MVSRGNVVPGSAKGNDRLLICCNDCNGLGVVDCANDACGLQNRGQTYRKKHCHVCMCCGGSGFMSNDTPATVRELRDELLALHRRYAVLLKEYALLEAQVMK